MFLCFGDNMDKLVNYLEINIFNQKNYQKVLLWFILIAVLSCIKTNVNKVRNSSITMYGEAADLIPASMIMTRDGGYLLTCNEQKLTEKTSHIKLIKTDPQGNVEWNYQFKSGNNYDLTYGVVQKQDGSYFFSGVRYADKKYILCGGTTSNGDSAGYNAYSLGVYDDEGRYIMKTSDGNYLLTGKTWSFRTGLGYYLPEGYLLKIDANGKKIWGRNINSYNTNILARSYEDKSGNYLGCGQSFQLYDTSHYFGALITKYSSSGTRIWVKEFHFKKHTYTMATGICGTADGAYMVAADTTDDQSTGTKSPVAGIMKIAPDGTKLWEKLYPPVEGYNFAENILPTQDGNFILFGKTQSSLTQIVYPMAIKLGPSGEIIWNKVYFGSRDADMVSLVQRPDGGYTAALSYESGYYLEGSKYHCAALLWLDANGNVLK